MFRIEWTNNLSVLYEEACFVKFSQNYPSTVFYSSIESASNNAAQQ